MEGNWDEISTCPVGCDADMPGRSDDWRSARIVVSLARVRALIIHNEQEYYAGAERVLINYVTGLRAAGEKPVVMAVAGTRVFRELAELTEVVPLAGNQPFSPVNLLKQLRQVCNQVSDIEPTILHAWAARDWELTSLAGALTHSSAMGTLHDHPKADFISRSRQRLMRLAARGLDRIVCVSGAVARACAQAGYSSEKLVTIHNGLASREMVSPKGGPVLRLGFLGAFSRRKGLETLFALISNFAQRTSSRWELRLAGDAQNEEGRHLWETVQERHCTAPWWKRVKHLGWTNDPMSFLAELDLLLFTSSDFDPLPTVLLESGQCGTPVFAANVGGVPEIVAEGANGWIFDPWEIGAASERLAALVKDKKELRGKGASATEHISRNFSLGKMIEQYQRIYSTLARP